MEYTALAFLQLLVPALQGSLVILMPLNLTSCGLVAYYIPLTVFCRVSHSYP